MITETNESLEQPIVVLWPKLLFGMLVTGICALSVHVILITYLHVPYPYGSANGGFLVYLNGSLADAAVVALYSLAATKLRRLSIPLQMLIVFVLLSMLQEQLIREPLMNAIDGGDWAYEFISNVPSLLPYAILSVLVVLMTPKLTQIWQKLAAGFVFSAIIRFICKPLINLAFQPFLHSIHYLWHDSRFSLPYGWQILLPAYLTYIEPVAATFAAAFLVWGRLSARTTTRIAQFTLLLLFIKGSILDPFIYAFHAKTHLLLAFASVGQFSLEDLVLAALAGMMWQLSTTRALGAELPATNRHSRQTA